jgi:stress-induced-phosphoprotein 1
MDIDEDAQRRLDALAAKDHGNALYKQKKFDEALVEFSKAKELDPTNMTFYNNEAATYFEMGRYEECIATCEKAVEVGREQRADFKLIAKAFGRIGNAYAKQGNYEQAIRFYNKSLTEHRTADILEKLRDIERAKKEQERASYHSPELSDRAREEGNDYFKTGEWAKAVERYSEAIKRNDTDPKAYSNRAACYTKLMAFPEALKDCEKSIALDPSFVKGYIRKAAIEFLKKEYNKCLATCEEALQHDAQGKHRGEIEAQMTRCYTATQQSTENMSDEEVLKRAAQDPEVQVCLANC